MSSDTIKLHNPWEPAEEPATQRNLFEDADTPAPGEIDNPSVEPIDSPPRQATDLLAEVVFDRPLDHPYSYAVPESLRESVAVGKRVLAPFGKHNQPTAGYIVSLVKTTPDRPVKDLLRVLDVESLLSPDLMRLTRWMADYYLCSWGQVLNKVVPTGAKEQAGTRNVIFLEAIPEAELPQPLPALTAKQKSVWKILQSAGRPVEVRQLAQQARCGMNPVESLVQKLLARKVVQRVDRFTNLHDEYSQPEPAVTLNADQLRIWPQVEQAVRQGGFHAFLLHGVTGSGKTEIYLRAIEETLRQGKEALVLVPEISLTPQTVSRFCGRFGATPEESALPEVAVLHSHLTNAERGGQWRRVAAGHAKIVVGARSAVFAPARNLGLIVIDEEHEGSFKQEATPRYHARDVAVMRARLENIPIILGSATPALESWYNAQRGQYTLLTLPNRVLDLPLPQVALIDLCHEAPGRGHLHALSPALERAMRDALRDGGQVILLLNRRGYSTYVHCPKCGHVETCKFCDLALTYHREHDAMLCHFCRYEKPPPQLCPQCGKTQIRYQGMATEKLQAEIEEKFPQSIVRRMDSDSMKRPRSHERVLAAFRRGLVHILLGTQMIAKGLDFPNVTLVGVVNADVGLHIPDFRSSERTFQLLSQVAGRAGRGPRGGKVLVQTFSPDHPSVLLAASHDYTSFVAQEMAHRHDHNYPPYQRLARLIVRSRDVQKAEGFADKLSSALQAAVQNLSTPAGSPPQVRILGPAEAPLFKLKGFYRFHFQMQSPSPATLHHVLRAVLPSLRPPSGVEFTVDIDPQDMR